MDYLSSLNEPQYQAVTTINGPIMVIAGPGSGKTRVLTYRISYLIEQGISPWNILALTFTNKSAREMKDRIQKVVGDKALQVWAGTFHSIFAKILRLEAPHIGFKSDFTIYDTTDSKSVLKEVIKNLNLDVKLYPPNLIMNRISSAKSNLITPEIYASNQELLEQDKQARRPMMPIIYQRYTKQLKQNMAMDFDDLLLNIYLLFKHNPEVLQKYRARFPFILVDEFQDTNQLQYAILKQLSRYPESPENICIVGDDAQSIYAFRGATIRNILDFQKDFPNTKVFKLEQNYRSTDYIVAAANDVIQHNKKQIQKVIWTDQVDGNKIQLIRAMSDAEEGRKIADSILEHKHRHHLKNEEIAILYRTNAQSRIFEEHLRKQNISYKVFGGLSFYQRKEIKDVLAYLRLIVNPSDNEAFKRVVNLPKRGIGKKSLDDLAQYANAHEISLWEAVDKANLSNAAKRKLVEFKQLMQQLIKYAKAHNAYETVLYVMKKSGLHQLYMTDPSIEGRGRIENINALIDGIQEFVESDELDEFDGDKSLTSYLQSIALITDFDQATDDQDFVSLMSVHAAKGLEYKAIFVVGLEENLFPSYMSKDDPMGIDEERRLFYVAITRSEAYLTLSYAQTRYQFGQLRTNPPSRFVDEINPERIAGITARAGASGQAGEVVPRARVGGNFRPSARRTAVKTPVDMNFVAADPKSIQEGMEVQHMRFGKGKVAAVEGGANNRIATIDFEDVDPKRKKIMLRFAKLMIVE